MATILNHQNIEPDAGLVAKIIAHDSQTPSANELHWHQALEITFMLDWPESVIVIGQNRVVHKSGDIWLVNPMQIHNYQALYKTAAPKALTILFPYNFLAAVYEDISLGYFEINLQRRDDLWRLGNDIWSLYRSDQKDAKVLQDIRLLQLLQELVAYHFRYRDEVDGHNELTFSVGRTAEVTNFVMTHFADEINTDLIAHQLNYSEAYIARLVKSEMGITVTQLINLVRADHAKHLIDTTNYRLDDIAVQVGFKNVKNMNRWMKRYFGNGSKSFRNQ